MKEMAREFSLFDGVLLVFEAQGQNTEQYRKVASAIQNAIQAYRVIYDEKRSYNPGITGSFSLFFFFPQESRKNWIQQGTRSCAINLRREWICSLPSIF